MDSVTEGMQNYGSIINAVETDLKKLGKSLFAEYGIKFYILLILASKFRCVYFHFHR